MLCSWLNKLYYSTGNTIELIQFLNTIYLPFDSKNEEVYENKCLTTNEILATVWKYSDLHEDKGAIGFAKWCKNRNIKFMSSSIKRKESENQTKRTRSLYVVKKEFIGKSYLLLLFFVSLVLILFMQYIRK